MVIETNIEDFANLKFHKDIFPFMNSCISNFHYIYVCVKKCMISSHYTYIFTHKKKTFEIAIQSKGSHEEPFSCCCYNSYVLHHVR